MECSICFEKKDVVKTSVKQAGHAYENVGTPVDATCIKGLYQVIKCNKCQYQTELQIGIPIGHDIDGVIADPAKHHDADCTTNESDTFVCKTCGADVVVEKPNTALGHNFTDEDVTAVGALIRTAKCYETGLYYKSCSVCDTVATADDIDASGKTYTFEVASTDHKYDAANYLWIVDVTCQHSGSYYRMCEDCKEIETHKEGNNTVQTVYNAAQVGHNYVVTSTTATCTKEGDINYKCSFNCGETKKETKQKLPHEFTVVVAATCEKDAYKKCANCDATENFTSEEIVAKPEYNKLGHKLTGETKVVAPTCTKGGYTLELCERCDGKIKDGSEIAALGHNFELTDPKVRVPATCVKGPGTKEICSRCAAENVVFDKDINGVDLLPDTNAHAWVTTLDKKNMKLAAAATCNTYATYYSYCTNGCAYGKNNTTAPKLIEDVAAGYGKHAAADIDEVEIKPLIECKAGTSEGQNRLYYEYCNKCGKTISEIKVTSMHNFDTIGHTNSNYDK